MLCMISTRWLLQTYTTLWGRKTLQAKFARSSKARSRSHLVGEQEKLSGGQERMALDTGRAFETADHKQPVSKDRWRGVVAIRRPDGNIQSPQHSTGAARRCSHCDRGGGRHELPR